MPGLEHGFQRAVIGALTGFIMSVFVSEFVKYLPEQQASLVIILFNLMTIASMLELIDKMKYWSTSYLIGWFIGISLFRGFIGVWEYMLYAVTALSIMAMRLIK